MSVRDGRLARARRRAAIQIIAAGQDLKLARQLAGLSIRASSEATGISPSAWSRLELGRLEDITLERLAVAAAAVGLAPSLKLYPGGDPLRDAPHVQRDGRTPDDESVWRCRFCGFVPPSGPTGGGRADF